MKAYIGKRFGKLEVFGTFYKPNAKGRRLWFICRCDCGKTRQCSKSDTVRLDKRAIKSCGCDKIVYKKHGLYKLPEYKIWKDVRKRCQNQKSGAFKNYGQRGITLDPRWNDFFVFIENMGQRPSPKHTIERHNNDGAYSPENCSWQLRSVQNNNKRNNRYIFFKGKKFTLAQLSVECGVNYRTLMKRLNYGWPIEEAVNLQKRVNQFG